MARRFRPPRYAVGLVAFPCAALVAAACGGTDYLDAPDAASLDGSITDAHGDTSFVDGQSADANGDADASSVDAHVDTGALDGGTLRDADAGLIDVDAGLPDVGLPDVGLPDVGLPDGALLDAGRDADAAILDASDASSDSGTSSLFPNLLTTTPFAILAGTTITNSGLTTIIKGDIGTNGPSVTGLTGPLQPTGLTELNTPRANQALLDVATTATILAGRTCPQGHDLSNMGLGGMILTPGVYCFSSAATQATLTTLTFDAQGDPNAVWIIQVGTTLTVMDNAIATIINGLPSMACRVFWSIGSAATINAGALFIGNIFANTSVSMLTGASLSPGRAFGQTGAVTLLGDTVSAALCQ